MLYLLHGSRTTDGTKQKQKDEKMITSGAEETFTHDIFRGLSNSKGQRIYFETQGQDKDAKIVIRIVDNGKDAVYEIPYADRKCLLDMHSVLNEIDGHVTRKAGNIFRTDDKTFGKVS